MFRLILVLCLFVTAGFSSPVEQTVVDPQPADVVQQPVVAAAGTNIPSVPEPEKPSEDTRAGRSFAHENEIQRPYDQVEESLLEKLNSKCAQRDVSSCAMLKLVTYMNRLLKKASLNVVDNVDIVQTSTYVEVKDEDLPRSFSGSSEEVQLAELMAAKLISYIRSRSLKLHLLPHLDAKITSNPDNDGNLNLGMTLEPVKDVEGRGKKNMGGLLAALVMKFGLLGALAFKGLVVLVGKALLVSKIALLLAVVIGLKKLFSHKKHVTYEVVAQPHHSHSHVEHSDSHGHDSYSSGWGRSIALKTTQGKVHEMAYKAYAPKTQ